jgi:hypothetical protein
MKFDIKRLLPFRTAPHVQSGAEPADIVRLADQHGYDVIKGPNGSLVPIPRDMRPSEVGSVLENWDSMYSNSHTTQGNRDKRLKSYQQMDGSGAEGAVVLDTYADEVVNITDSSDKSIEVRISDKEVAKKVMQVLATNGVLQNVRADVRSMCKYGDMVYCLEARRGADLVRIVEGDAEKGNRIDNPLRPQDISLRFLRATSYELAGYKDRVFKARIVEDELTGGLKMDREELLPWEFVVFAIVDRDAFPYGCSILEKMRLPFEQLTIVEKLLAVTRANKVDRVAVKVPGLGGDVTSMMNKLTQIKNSIKTILQTGASSRMTRNQDVGLTEWLYVPDSFKLEKLSTNTDVGSVADAEFFRDKLYNASRLPKGFFVLSEPGGAQRPMSLRQQDLKFARSLIPVSEAYCRGLKRLIELLVFYLGGDISTVKVEVSMKKSAYISSDLLSTYKDALGLVEMQNSLRKALDAEYQPTADDIRALLAVIDVPANLLFPGSSGPEEFDGNSSGPASLYEWCKGQVPAATASTRLLNEG